MPKHSFRDCVSFPPAFLLGDREEHQGRCNLALMYKCDLMALQLSRRFGRLGHRMMYVEGFTWTRCYCAKQSVELYYLLCARCHTRKIYALRICSKKNYSQQLASQMSLLQEVLNVILEPALQNEFVIMLSFWRSSFLLALTPYKNCRRTLMMICPVKRLIMTVSSFKANDATSSSLSFSTSPSIFLILVW